MDDYADRQRIQAIFDEGWRDYMREYRKTYSPSPAQVIHARELNAAAARRYRARKRAKAQRVEAAKSAPTPQQRWDAWQAERHVTATPPENTRARESSDSRDARAKRISGVAVT